MWVVDLIGPLPPGSSGQLYCIVCIDVFSKFVVAKALPDKSSAATASFFYDSIICEYGTPRALRCDNGKEFQGQFAELLKLFKIYRFPASSYYPQALG